MGVFNRKFNFPDDNIITQFNMSQEYEPRNNKTVQEIIDTIDDSKVEGLPKLNSTFPRMNLKQAQLFCESLKQYFAVNNNQEVLVEELELFQKNNKKKWEKYLLINDLKISMRFLNLSVPVIEEIFTSEEFDEISYSDKEQTAEEFLHEFQRQTGLPTPQLAHIPTEEEVENDDFDVINPEVKKQREESAKKEKIKQETVPKPKQQVTNKKPSNSVSQSRSSQSQPAIHNSSPNPGQVSSSGAVSTRSRTQAAQVGIINNDGIKILNDGHVYPQQFEIKKLPETFADPSSSNYVEYMLNEKRKEYNSAINSYSEKLNLETDKSLNKKAAEYRQILDEKVNKYQKDNINPSVLNDIKAKTKQRLLREQEIERSNEINNIESSKKQKILEAQRIFEKTKNDAEHEATLKTQNLDKKLATKYADLANNQSETKVDQLSKKVEEQINKIITKEVSAANSNLNGSALSIQEQNTKQINKVFEKFSALLVDASEVYANQHSNAVRAKADADAAKYKLEDAENDKKALTDYQNKYDKEHQDYLSLQAKFNDLDSKFNSIKQELKDKESQLQNLQNNTNGSGSSNDNFDKLLSAIVLQNNKPNQEQPKIQKRSHVVPWLVGILISVVVVGAGSVGTLAYQNQNQSNKRIAKISNSTKEMNQKISDTNKKLDESQSKLKKNQQKNSELKDELQSEKNRNDQLQDNLINMNKDQGETK
ncbi:hypothetical protein [Fructilactobacillus cliffordii]|uniref:Uncharacterized protein n=1 Tax=Fructilactobacillus cliffordii TaxID=2940299 RepID=A0A9Q8ZVC5_9LACO|nr:hypothetical protein [Fructilactobacillus cliffordii]USS90003.1 hypothetical protein M3M40_07200 [Fructilactobacillus cliffordii]